MFLPLASFTTFPLFHELVAISVLWAAITPALAALPHGSWSTSELSAARSNLAATHVGDLALFAGGVGVTSELLIASGLSVMMVCDGVGAQLCGILDPQFHC
jgi:hypothetical protein